MECRLTRKTLRRGSPDPFKRCFASPTISLDPPKAASLYSIACLELRAADHTGKRHHRIRKQGKPSCDTHSSTAAKTN